MAVFAFDKKMEQAVHVGSDEIIEGTFIKAANVVDISGAVNGDVVVAGNSINISGPVAGDVIAAGNTIKISGDVGGSVRVVGSSVDISSFVEKNVWAVGGTVALADSSKVGWDVFAGGGSVEIKGSVGRSVWAGAGTLVIANEVGKDVMALLETEGQLFLYPQAEVSGNLTYQAAADDQLVVQEGAQVFGETSRKNLIAPSEAELDKSFGAFFVFLKITSFFSLLVIGLVFVLLVPKLTLHVQEVMVKKPWVSLGWGFVFLVVVPVAVFLLMITVIGIPLALIMIPLYFIAIYVSQIFAGLAIGLLIFDHLNKNKKYKGSLVWPLVLGLLLVMIVCLALWVVFLPLALLVKFLLILWALGGIAQVKKEVIQEYR